jgi:membrane protein implicated in regulation of membrane protease activity
MPELGRTLMLVGGLLLLIGLLLSLGGRIPWLGRLPGDILVERKNFSFYFPLMTSVVVSVVLTILMMLFRK